MQRSHGISACACALFAAHFLGACTGSIGDGVTPPTDEANPPDVPPRMPTTPEPMPPEADCVDRRSTRTINESEWQATGPGGGYVTRMARAGTTLLVGTGRTSSGGGFGSQAGALYRRDESTYSKVAGLEDASIRDIEISSDGTAWIASGSNRPSDSSGVFILPSDGDAEVTMAGLHTGARPIDLAVGSDDVAYALVLGTPADPIVAIASLYRFDGQTWSVVAADGLDQSTGGPIAAIAGDPNVDGRLYAVNGRQLFASDDAGETFTGSALPLGIRGGPLDPTGIHIDPTDGAHIFVRTRAGLLESSDGGQSFVTLESIGVQPVSDVQFAADRTYVTTLTGGLFGTGESGILQPIGRCLSIRGTTAVATDADGAIVVGTSGGSVWRSEDGAETFAPGAPGIDEQLARAVTIGTRAFLLSATGSYELENDGQSWSAIEGIASGSSFSSIAEDPRAPGRLLLTRNGDLFPGADAAGGLFELIDGVIAPLGDRGDERLAAVRFDPMNDGRVMAYQVRGTSQEPIEARIGVIVSDDDGASFSDSGMQSYDTFPSFPYTFPSSPIATTSTGRTYAGALVNEGGGQISHALLASDDGRTFVEVWSNRDDPDLMKQAMGVYVDAADNVYIAGWNDGEVLWRSEDGGESFTPMTTGFDSAVTRVVDLAFDSNGRVLAATNQGVYLSDGDEFVALPDALLTQAAISVALVEGEPMKAIVATSDRGVLWRALP